MILWKCMGVPGSTMHHVGVFIRQNGTVCHSANEHTHMVMVGEKITWPKAEGFLCSPQNKWCIYCAKMHTYVF